MPASSSLAHTPGSTVMIVEDEFLIAANLESIVEDCGFRSVGIAPDSVTALALANDNPDIALVDIHLSDGPTGIEVGRTLAQRGVAVMYVTANPRMLGDRIPGTLGVMAKPCEPEQVQQLLRFAASWRIGKPAEPPADFVAFAP